MAVIWEKVPDEVLEVAQGIISEHLSDLEEFNIGFVFRSEPGTSGGREVWGQASKVPEKLKTHLNLDGHIWLANPIWQMLSPMGKRALVHHELLHFAVNDGALTMRGHDVEEFGIIIQLYGLWKGDLRAIAPAFVEATQLTLPEFERPRRQGGVMALEPELAEAAL